MEESLIFNLKKSIESDDICEMQSIFNSICDENLIIKVSIIKFNRPEFHLTIEQGTVNEDWLKKILQMCDIHCWEKKYNIYTFFKCIDNKNYMSLLNNMYH